MDIIFAYNKQSDIDILFRKYYQVLIEADPAFKKYLSNQSYEEEFKKMNIDYKFPNERIYVVYYNEKVSRMYSSS